MDWTTGAALIVVEIGALAGAIWAMMRVVKGVRSDIANRVEEAVTLRRDIDELGRRLGEMAARSKEDHAAIREELHEARDGRKSLHLRLDDMTTQMSDIKTEVKVVRARIDAHGVNGGAS